MSSIPNITPNTTISCSSLLFSSHLASPHTEEIQYAHSIILTVILLVVDVDGRKRNERKPHSLWAVWKTKTIGIIRTE